MSVRELRFNFGKHRGKSLEEVYLEEKSYLEWLADLDEADCPDFMEEWRDRAKECLTEMKKVRIY